MKPTLILLTALLLAPLAALHAADTTPSKPITTPRLHHEFEGSSLKKM